MSAIGSPPLSENQPLLEKVVARTEQIGRSAKKHWSAFSGPLSRAKGIKNATMDMWRVGTNIKRLVIELIKNEFFNDLFKTARNANDAVVSVSNSGGFSDKVRLVVGKIQRVLRWTGVFSIVSLPFSLWGVARKGYKIIRNRPGRVENFFNIIKDIGGMCGNISGFASSLASVGAVSASSVSFAGPLSIVGSVLGLAGQIIRIHSFCCTCIFSHRFNKIAKPRSGVSFDETFNNALDFLITQQNSNKKIKDRRLYKLGKHFDFGGRKLNHRLLEIREKSEALTVREKKKILKSLKSRIIVKQLSTAFAFVTGTIGFLACPIFALAPLVCPPLLSLGFVCVAISSGGSAFRFVADWFTEARFNKATKRFYNKALAIPEDPFKAMDVEGLVEACQQG